MRHAIDDLQLAGRAGMLQRCSKRAGFAADEAIGAALQEEARR